MATLPSGNVKKTILDTATSYYGSNKPIHLAANFNQPAIARALLDEGAGIVIAPINQWCLLIMSIDPNAKNLYGKSALHVTCSDSSDEDVAEIVKLLIERYYNNIII